MTNAEKIQKIQEYLNDLGWYVLAMLDIDEVKEHLEDSVDKPIDEEELRRCCEYVARKFDGSNESMLAIEWASELYLENEGIKP